ncbi:MAG: hypothetical protein COX62_00615 [Deltaproteobacteria bacterium CG_4_10_14_0_2_um_filter_43_8]|nr:MAG: hypothetical protein COV43_06015 [Deltaproteobacteria bacterium CG11_big_fil_rev_8_21_14_0_20_42_23]PJA22148.1 MAG: hypothetical protein COX62_00615 [Deltaproteobacteria bacterium CG_4_10_14_0_2_um_filter_43_8]PJC65136.1 MAG: hypothetical protein CO021_01420 [Deltaproteobacteria bacterium CG_4_9_14_0_2_um_filter_42_21]
MSKIIPGNQFPEVLREQVRLAFVEQDCTASECTEYYLVNLLQQFHTAEKFFEPNNDSHFSEKPLAISLLEAMSGDLATKTRSLKRIGDTALYITGFFSDSIKRQLVDEDYYISMGGSAYGSLAALFAQEKTFSHLYTELAENFSQFVHVLSAIAPWHHAHNNRDLIKLYERWLKTGDEKLARALQEQGLIRKGEL